MKTNPIRRAALFSALTAFGAAVLAQGYPGGGMGRRHEGGRTQTPGADDKQREMPLPPHALAVLAASLEREAPGMNLAPDAARAMSDFVRELRDFADIDDRRVRERIGAARAPVHANVDLQRDLADIEESAHEVDAAARDVAARWTKLRELLTGAQRDHVEGLYSAALIDARPDGASRSRFQSR